MKKEYPISNSAFTKIHLGRQGIINNEGKKSVKVCGKKQLDGEQNAIDCRENKFSGRM